MDYKFNINIFLYTLLVIIITSVRVIGQDIYDITVFGTDKISNKEIEKNYGEQLNHLLILHSEDRKEYNKQRDLLNNQLLLLGDFAFVNVYLFQSYSNNTSYIIDFVEESERNLRMNYRLVHTRAIEDPAQLIRKWNEYQGMSFELYNKGEIGDMSCPVIHCVWSFNHPKLEHFLKVFNTLAVTYKNELIEILNYSNSSEDRASSAFLLAHSGLEPQELLDVLMPTIIDPESIVRNNSMRVIYYIVRAHPKSKINVSKVIEALDFPSFTDRNKALVILRSLPLQNLSESDKKRLYPILLEILRKKDAHNYRNAHSVFKNISSMDYSADEIEKWEAWTMKN